MTLKSPNTRDHDFLILTYTELDYLVNRDQLFASLFLEETTEFESGFSYLSATMQYREHTLPVFDFDAFLRDIFQCKVESLVKFALICELASFSGHNRAIYQESILQEHQELSAEYLALTVSSQAEIKRIPLAEINLVPLGIRSKQNKEGVLGCRFSADGKIQYFLDIETIVMNCIV